MSTLLFFKNSSTSSPHAKQPRGLTPIFFQSKESIDSRMIFSSSAIIKLHDINDLKIVFFTNEEKEKYILERLEREGKDGTITHIEKNTYICYTKTRRLYESICY